MTVLDAKPEGQQKEVLDMLVRWYADYRAGKPVPQFFYVGGYAGVGKTFLVKFFMEMVGLKAWDVRLMTFMARSALILSNASGLPASTIHSNIYKSELRRGVEEWVLDRDSNVRNAKLFILDECSMVGTNMFKDLTSFGRPILILGDPGQLLPIGDDILFPKMQPHYFLTEIRRQALDNPIIKLSMLARQGQEIPPGEYQNGQGVVKARKIPLQKITPEDWRAADAVLTFSRAARAQMNLTFREAYGYAQRSAYPVAGDKIMCLRNKQRDGLVNGMLGVSMKDVEPPDAMDSLYVHIDFKPDGEDHVREKLESLRSYFAPMVNTVGQVVNDPEFAKKRYHHFDYAYAMTGHKALGSQFPYVIIIDHNDQHDRSRWLYTAITRAQDRLDIGY